MGSKKCNRPTAISLNLGEFERDSIRTEGALTGGPYEVKSVYPKGTFRKGSVKGKPKDTKKKMEGLITDTHRK